MKNPIFTAVLLVGLAIAAVIGYLQNDDEWLTRDMFVSAAQASPDIGPATGIMFPMLDVLHGERPVDNIAEFARGKGVVVIALRSVDWCRYCKKQLIQLQSRRHIFDAHNVGLVAITYDAPAAQQAFIDEHGITIPVLSDEASALFNTLGILNEDVEPDSHQYGIPNPGLIVVSPGQEIVGSLFVDGPEKRVEADEVLAYARRVLELNSPFDGR